MKLPRARNSSICPETVGVWLLHDQNDIEEVHHQVLHALCDIPDKVHAVINYDNFSILPDLIDAYVKMVKDLTQSYYQTVTR